MKDFDNFNLSKCAWKNSDICKSVTCNLDLSGNKSCALVCDKFCDDVNDNYNPCCEDGYVGKECAKCVCNTSACWYRNESGCNLCTENSDNITIFACTALALGVLLVFSLVIKNPKLQFFSLVIETLIVLLVMVTAIENEAWLGIVIIMILLAVVRNSLFVDPIRNF